MTLPAIYLISLVIAPQLWLEPFVGIRVDYFIYPIWLVTLFMTGKVQKINFGVQEKFFVLWILWMFITVVVNGELDKRLNLLFDYFKWFILFLIVQATLDTEASVKGIVRFIVFLSLVLGIEGIQHYMNEIGWAGQALGWVSEGAKGRTRWVGIFDGPGVFCVVYTIALPFTIHYFFTAKSTFYKCVAVVSTGILSVAIFYNGSRGGFLAALSIIIGYVIFRSKNRIAIVYGAIIVAVLFMAAPSHMTNMSDKQHSSSTRVEMWAYGCDMFKANPVFGVGRGGFKQHSGSLLAHNSFIEIMAETGLIGLFFWTGLLYSNLKGLAAACVLESEEARTLALPLTLCIIGYLVSAMFVTLEYETLYFLLALSAAFSRNVGIIPRLDGIDLKRILAVNIAFILGINLFVTFLGPSAFR